MKPKTLNNHQLSAVSHLQESKCKLRNYLIFRKILTVIQFLIFYLVLLEKQFIQNQENLIIRQKQREAEVLLEQIDIVKKIDIAKKIIDETAEKADKKRESPF